MKPGIFRMTEEEYHEDPCPTPSLSSSIAKTLVNQSPRHAWENHPRLNPAYQEDPDKRFSLGKAAHRVILEGNWDSVEVIDPEDFRGKNGSVPVGWTNAAIKGARDSALAEGKSPILRSDANDIELMDAAVKKFIATTELAEHFPTAKSELSIFWQEDEIWLRSRFDKVFILEELGQGIIIDYKSTTNASPDAFGRVMTQLSYPMQSAFYRRGLRSVRPDLTKDPIFLFLAQENTSPYSCSLHSLSELAVKMAESKVQKAIDLWKHCTKSDQWDAYPSMIHYQEPPAWEANRFLEEYPEEEIEL